MLLLITLNVCRGLYICAWVCFVSCRPKCSRKLHFTVEMVLEKVIIKLFLPPHPWTCLFAAAVPSCLCPRSSHINNPSQMTFSSLVLHPFLDLVFLTVLSKQCGPFMVLLCSYLDVSSLVPQDCILPSDYLVCAAHISFTLYTFYKKLSDLVFTFLPNSKHGQFLLCSLQYQSNRIICFVLTQYLHPWIFSLPSQFPSKTS